MGREVRRVPLDFDWPLDQVWNGFIRPDALDEPQCSDCEGEGYGPEARAIAHTFYPHQIGQNGDALAWHDKIGQAEVDNLIEHGRLHVLESREPTEDNPRDWEWVAKPRTAAEINGLNQRVGINSHDALNRMILIAFRCERLGIALECPTCSGHGSVEKYEGQRAEAEAWQPTDPPSGDGWQLWETVSEGSPISPVFAAPEDLARWMASPAYTRALSPITYDAALRFVHDGWAPSFIVSDGAVISGESFIGGAS